MTHSRWPGGRLARALAAALMLAGAITAVGLARALAAPAAGCRELDRHAAAQSRAASATPSTVSRSCRPATPGRWASRPAAAWTAP